MFMIDSPSTDRKKSVDCKELLRRDMAAFILRYDRKSQDPDMRKVMCENIGRFIQSKEISKLSFQKIMEILNDEKTEILKDDLKILASYIKGRYPDRGQEIFKTTAVKKLKEHLQDENGLFDDNIQYVSNPSQGLDNLLKLPQQTPLLNIAFQSGDYDLFEAAIEHDFDSTKKFMGYDPVDFEIVKCPDHEKAKKFFSLLKVFSRENVDDEGNTLLMAAIQSRFPADYIGKITLQQPRMNVQNKRLENAFHIAASYINDDYIQYLINLNEDHSQFLNQQDINGNTPIHIAAKHNLNNMKLLMFEGIDLKIKNNDLDTALHIVIKSHSDDEAAEHYKDVTKDIMKFSSGGYSIGDRDGNTPLHIAIKKRCLKLIKLISEGNPEVLEIKNNDSLTPIDMCAQTDDPDVFAALFPDGRRIPWIQLTKWSSQKIIEQNKQKINFDDTDEEGNTIFHLALMNPKCSTIANIYFDIIKSTKKFDVLQVANKAGEVPTVLIDSNNFSKIYNNIFNGMKVTDQQELECRLRNHDTSIIKHIFEMPESDNKNLLLSTVAKYCNSRQWEQFSKGDENLTACLRSSIQCGNIEIAKYFIKKMENPWKPVTIIIETKPINIECLNFVIAEYPEFDKTDDELVIGAIKANCPEAVALLISDNFDVDSVIEIVTNTNYQMMSVVFDKHHDKITKEVFFMTVHNKNNGTMRYCLEKKAEIDRDLEDANFQNATDENNNTALGNLLIDWCHNGSGERDLIEMLIEYGSEINDTPVYDGYYIEQEGEEKGKLYEFKSIGEYLIELNNIEALQVLCDLNLTKTEEMLKSLIKKNYNEDTINQFVNSLTENKDKIKDINTLIHLAATNNLKTIAQRFINYALKNNTSIEMRKSYVDLSKSLDDNIIPHEILDSILKNEAFETPSEKKEPIRNRVIFDAKKYEELKNDNKKLQESLSDLIQKLNSSESQINDLKNLCREKENQIATLASYKDTMDQKICDLTSEKQKLITEIEKLKKDKVSKKSKEYYEKEIISLKTQLNNVYNSLIQAKSTDGLNLQGLIGIVEKLVKYIKDRNPQFPVPQFRGESQ